MAYTIQNIIDRARIYVDDNHKVTDGWKQPADWLTIAKPELVSCYRNWVRKSLISFTPLQGSFTGPTFQFAAGIQPLAILGVAQGSGSNFRLIQPAMAQYGRQPYWDTTAATATTWTVSVDVFPDGTGEPQYSLSLHPPNTTAGYQIKYIRFPELSALDKFVILPEGYEDYVALLIARKALASEGASSQAIERLIMKAEADIGMDTLSGPQGDGPKVRVVRPFNKQRVFTNSTTWPLNPAFWFYP
jgi:hypothetical protein